MHQSVIYQGWKEEWEQTGILKGERSLLLRLLDRRIGDVPAEAKLQIQSLPLEQLEALGAALH